MTNESRHSMPVPPQPEVNGLGKEVLSPSDFAKLIPAVGKNMNLFYLLSMARNPDRAYSAQINPLYPLTAVDRLKSSIDPYFLKPNDLTDDALVGVQHYYANCEEREARVHAPKLSKRGKELGVPVAGLLADFALRHEVVMDRIFLDDTYSFYHPGDDAVLQRLELLKEMSAIGEEYDCSDYKTALEQDSTISKRRNIAFALSKLGWADFSSKTNKGGLQSAFTYKITARGMSALGELLAILEGVRTKDPEIIKRGQKLADEIKSDESRLAKLTALVKADRSRN